MEEDEEQEEEVKKEEEDDEEEEKENAVEEEKGEEACWSCKRPTRTLGAALRETLISSLSSSFSSPLVSDFDKNK